jgi:hypothetical protein
MNKTKTIKAYKLLNEILEGEISESPIRRDWMDEDNSIYRCLPMTIANQNGWVVESPCDVTASWVGGKASDGVHFLVDTSYSSPQRFVDCIFGNGIITFFMNFIVRTPPGVNLLVRGAPNFYIDGAHPLEGVVETDWLNFTFTMNWKITSPGKTIYFKKGDPICFLQPVPHNYSEEFNFEINSIEINPELKEKFNAYNKARIDFLNNPAGKSWQGNYFKGEDVSGGPVASEDVHSVKLKISKPLSLIEKNE